MRAGFSGGEAVMGLYVSKSVYVTRPRERDPATHRLGTDYAPLPDEPAGAANLRAAADGLRRAHQYLPHGLYAV